MYRKTEKPEPDINRKQKLIKQLRREAVIKTAGSAAALFIISRKTKETLT